MAKLYVPNIVKIQIKCLFEAYTRNITRKVGLCINLRDVRRKIRIIVLHSKQLRLLQFQMSKDEKQEVNQELESEIRKKFPYVLN